MGKSVNEVRRAVDWVDDKKLSLGREFLCRAFFAYKMCVGHYLQKTGPQSVLYFLVAVRDEIGMTGLRVDLQRCPVDVLYGSTTFAHQLAYCLYVVFHLFPSCLQVVAYRNRIPYIAVVCIA